MPTFNAEVHLILNIKLAYHSYEKITDNYAVIRNT